MLNFFKAKIDLIKELWENDQTSIRREENSGNFSNNIKKYNILERNENSYIYIFLLKFLNKASNIFNSSEDYSKISNFEFLPIVNKYTSQIFSSDPGLQYNIKSTNQDDFGNYKEKQKLQELKILQKNKTPPKITKSMN